MPSTTAEPSAPPTPWANRLATSISGLFATPANTDASVKTVTPARNTLLAPIRSPSRPANRSRPPKATRKAFTTQGSPVGLNPRSRWMVGSATFTTVPSRITMSWVADSTVRASQRLPACPAGAASIP